MPGYARGSRAWGTCMRCGLQFLLKELTFDGYYPNIRVCDGCYDPPQPQERLAVVSDPEALWHPSPDDPPFGPVLSLGVGAGKILNWTPGDPSGRARFETYTVTRALSADAGATFGAPATLQVQTCTYDAFGGVIFQPHTYTDLTLPVGIFASYAIVAADSNGNGSASNPIITQG